VAVVLALSGTAATSPAYAITPKSDGTVFVKVNFGGPNTLLAAGTRLIDKYHETVIRTGKDRLCEKPGACGRLVALGVDGFGRWA
jgi:hypothetical protein